MQFEHGAQLGVGPNGDFILDAHTRFDFADIARLCDLVAPYAPLFVEDPLRSENPGVLKNFRAYEYATQVHAGLSVGWLHYTVATAGERPLGRGHFLACTFRISSHLNSNPLAAGSGTAVS